MSSGTRTTAVMMTGHMSQAYADQVRPVSRGSVPSAVAGLPEDASPDREAAPARAPGTSSVY
jgi:hypothetical protein